MEKKKTFYEEALELFGEQRDLTGGEQKALSEGLEKISKPTGKNFFDLIDEK